MKQRNLRKLINHLKNNVTEFNWNSELSCVGYQVTNILGRSFYSDFIQNIKDFLSCDLETAEKFYYGGYTKKEFDSRCARDSSEIYVYGNGFSKESAIKYLETYIRKVNREGLRKLIKAVKNAENFNVGNPFACIGHQSKGINHIGVGSDSLAELLDITREQVLHLYNGRDLDGNILIPYNKQELEYSDWQKSVILKYLRSLNY